MKDLSEYYLHCENGNELYDGEVIDVYYGYWIDRESEDGEIYDGIAPISLSCDEYTHAKQGSLEGAVNPMAFLLSSLVSC